MTQHWRNYKKMPALLTIIVLTTNKYHNIIKFLFLAFISFEKLSLINNWTFLFGENSPIISYSFFLIRYFLSQKRSIVHLHPKLPMQIAGRCSSNITLTCPASRKIWSWITYQFRDILHLY